MFRDRELFLIGAGALLAVFCLLLPFPFVVRAAAGFLVLVGFMFLALLRLGPDRVPPEEWLRRMLLYRLRARLYTFKQKDGKVFKPEGNPVKRTPEKVPDLQIVGRIKKLPRLRSDPALTLRGGLRVGPVILAFAEAGVYRLAGVFLFVIGVYFLIWLVQGGAEQISKDFTFLLRLVRGGSPSIR